MRPSDIDTEFIKEWLEHGEVRRIAKDIGVTENTVHNALNKRTRNFAVLELCYSKALERVNKFIAMREQQNLLAQKIQNLLS